MVDFVEKTWKEMQTIKKAEEGKHEMPTKDDGRAKIVLKNARESLEKMNEAKYLSPKRSLERLLFSERHCMA